MRLLIYSFLTFHLKSMHVLDDMGDKSDAETREQCFLDIDEDGSGAIDFEEFLGVTAIIRQ